LSETPDAPDEDEEEDELLLLLLLPILAGSSTGLYVTPLMCKNEGGPWMHPGAPSAGCREFSAYDWMGLGYMG
jgi:hypothetical protein